MVEEETHKNRLLLLEKIQETWARMILLQLGDKERERLEIKIEKLRDKLWKLDYEVRPDRPQLGTALSEEFRPPEGKRRWSERRR